MDVNIMILNVLDYQDKDTKKDKSRMSFIFTDKTYFQDKESYLGYGEVAVFYDNHIRQLIPTKAIGKPITARVQTRGSLRNPMKSYSVIESIDVDGKVISLLQP